MRNNWRVWLLEIVVAAGYFTALTVLIVVWRQGRYGWGFFIHLLITAALGASLFATRLSGRRLRLPFSAPEILLVFVFIYAILNAVFSRVAFPAIERLPFLLDGLILFYVGRSLFARRYEGILLLFILCGAGFWWGERHLGDSEAGNVKTEASAFYRGGRLTDAAISERPLLGCGCGALDYVCAKYLPLPKRHPPGFHSSYGIFLAEEGIIGVLVWLGFIATLVYSLIRRKGRFSGGRRMRSFCFWLIVGALFAIFVSGFVTTIFATPVGFFIFLPLTGMALGLSGNPEKRTRSQGCASSANLGFSLAVLIPLALLMLIESTPAIATALVKSRRRGEPGSRGFERRLRVAAFLMPYNPEIRLLYAKHLRALPADAMKGRLFLIDVAYQRALNLNRYCARYYIEYAHFLNLRGEYTKMVSVLEAGKIYCPGSVEVRLLLFRGYIRTGQRGAALAVLNSLGAFYPIDFATQYRIGHYYTEMGQEHHSLEAYALAAQLIPGFYRGKK